MSNKEYDISMKADDFIEVKKAVKKRMKDQNLSLDDATYKLYDTACMYDLEDEYESLMSHIAEKILRDKLEDDLIYKHRRRYKVTVEPHKVEKALIKMVKTDLENDKVDVI